MQRLSGRQWLWLGVVGLALLFMLVEAKRAYDLNALGPHVGSYVSAVIWAVPIVLTIATLLGIADALRTTTSELAVRLLNRVRYRIAAIAILVAAGTMFLIAAHFAGPPRIWTCAIERRVIGAADHVRCAEGFSRRRSYVLTLKRSSDPSATPVIRARAVDRTHVSVAIDSDAGGLCASTGPDVPVWGESRLSLTENCGADRTFAVNVHVCDSSTAATVPRAELRAAVNFEILEDHNAQAIECD